MVLILLLDTIESVVNLSNEIGYPLCPVVKISLFNIFIWSAPISQTAEISGRFDSIFKLEITASYLKPSFETFT